LFDFVSRRKWFFLISTIIIMIGIIALIVSGLNLGLDFKSGTTMTVIFQNPVEINNLRPVFNDLGYLDASFQKSPKDAFLFDKFPADATDPLLDGLQSSLGTTVRIAEFESDGNITTTAIILGEPISTEEFSQELAKIEYGANTTLGNLTFEQKTLDSYLIRIGEQRVESTTQKESRVPVLQLQGANMTTVEPAANDTITQDEQERIEGNETETELDDEHGANDTDVEPPDGNQGANDTANETEDEEPGANDTIVEPGDDREGEQPPTSAQRLIKATLQEEFGPVDYLDYSTISAAVSSERVNYTIYAILIASIGILLYVGWAFRKLSKSFRFGICAIIALIHDALLVLAIFALFRLEVNAMFIIAELTVIGYSVNNTIVIFDRIRENRMRFLNLPFDIVVNKSLNETLTRSLNTSITTLFVLIALILFGGETISTFVLALIIGVIAGTYSSLLIASQLVVAWEQGQIQRIFSWIPLPKRERED